MAAFSAADALYTMSHYALRCVACGRRYDDDGLRLKCDEQHATSLLRTEYVQTSFAPDESAAGILRYAAWLPIRGAIRSDGLTAAFQSPALCDALQTPNLWLAFNGFWPERGANLESATFKELEAAAVTARFPRDGTVLVAASAGNTAVALAQACGRANIPAIIVVPARAAGSLRMVCDPGPGVRFIAVAGATYNEAIAFARTVGSAEGFAFEGGAENVARRDGIGTTLLRSVEQMGRLPDVMVHGTGTGSGAIAAHEAAMRLLASSRYGAIAPRQFLVQNAPSAPVHRAWSQRSAHLLREDDTEQRDALGSLTAHVLGNTQPPYATAGGLYSVLLESGGDTVAVSNEAAHLSAELFIRLESVDIEPAAAVALAGLRAALEDGRISRTAQILLHVSGGGRSNSLAQRPYTPEVLLVGADHAARLIEAA